MKCLAFGHVAWEGQKWNEKPGLLLSRPWPCPLAHGIPLSIIPLLKNFWIIRADTMQILLLLVNEHVSLPFVLPPLPLVGVLMYCADLRNLDHNRDSREFPGANPP